MSQWSNTIPQIADGSTLVNAASINSVVGVLAGREQFLFDQLNSYSDKTILLSYNQPFSANLPVGTPVYFNTSLGSSPVLDYAKAGFAQSPNPAHLTPQPSAYVFGIVKSVYSGSSSLGTYYYGDVYVYGLAQGISFASLMDTASYTGNEPLPGPLYLSSCQPGKYTTTPGGASVFVGYIVSSGPSPNFCSIFLAPNVDSLNQMYFNYSLPIAAVSAGTTTLGSSWAVSSSDITKIGWIGAAEAVSLSLVSAIPSVTVGGTAYSPAFYYNIPTAASLITNSHGYTPDQVTNALRLKEALPPYPGAYTMLFSNGVLQPQLSTSAANGVYYIDGNGLWWMNATDGYQPFDHNSSGTALSNSPLDLRLLVTKLNPNLKETLVTSIKSNNNTIGVADTATGLPSSTGDLTLSFTPSFNPVSAGATGTGLQGISYDSVNQVFVLGTSPVVNSIISGPGLSVSTTGGIATIALNSALQGEVTDLEPEEADYVYRGLHSYLRLRKPAAGQRMGFVGKFLLPNSIPTGTNLTIQLLSFGEIAAPGNIGDTATFAFEYSVSAPNAPVNVNVASSAVNIGQAYFQGYTATLVSNDSSTGLPFFQVPNSALVPGAYLNFRVARTNVATGASVPIGVIGVLWNIS